MTITTSLQRLFSNSNFAKRFEKGDCPLWTPLLYPTLSFVLPNPFSLPNKAQAEPRGPGAAGHPRAGGAARQHPPEAGRGRGGRRQEAQGGEQGGGDSTGFFGPNVTLQSLHT